MGTMSGCKVCYTCENYAISRVVHVREGRLDYELKRGSRPSNYKCSDWLSNNPIPKITTTCPSPSRNSPNKWDQPDGQSKEFWKNKESGEKSRVQSHGQSRGPSRRPSVYGQNDNSRGSSNYNGNQSHYSIADAVHRMFDRKPEGGDRGRKSRDKSRERGASNSRAGRRARSESRGRRRRGKRGNLGTLGKNSEAASRRPSFNR